MRESSFGRRWDCLEGEMEEVMRRKDVQKSCNYPERCDVIYTDTKKLKREACYEIGEG